MSENSLKPDKFYARALDPIHIGAGGYRLGRVDNTIVRDVATEVPYLPGSSIAGVVREFYISYKNKEKLEEEKDKTEELFGSDSKKGKLRFYDGQIIFFPVSSIQGTVWITTKRLIEYWFEGIEIPNGTDAEAYKIKGNLGKNEEGDTYLNLNWLYLKVENTIEGKGITLPPEIQNWAEKIILISEKLFSHIINDNLEVRTSVKIDPATGSAKKGGLFTYEAISRGTILGFEIGLEYKEDGSISVKDIIDDVSPYFEYLGIGGMTTRGFGRLELSNKGSESKGITPTESSKGENNG